MDRITIQRNGMCYMCSQPLISIDSPYTNVRNWQHPNSLIKCDLSGVLNNKLELAQKLLLKYYNSGGIINVSFKCKWCDIVDIINIAPCSMVPNNVILIINDSYHIDPNEIIKLMSTASKQMTLTDINDYTCSRLECRTDIPIEELSQMVGLVYQYQISYTCNIEKLYLIALNNSYKVYRQFYLDASNNGIMYRKLMSKCKCIKCNCDSNWYYCNGCIIQIENGNNSVIVTIPFNAPNDFIKYIKSKLQWMELLSSPRMNNNKCQLCGLNKKTSSDQSYSKYWIIGKKYVKLSYQSPLTGENKSVCTICLERNTTI